jgi:hypothetical protein
MLQETVFFYLPSALHEFSFAHKRDDITWSAVLETVASRGELRHASFVYYSAYFWNAVLHRYVDLDSSRFFTATLEVRANSSFKSN